MLVLLYIVSALELWENARRKQWKNVKCSLVQILEVALQKTPDVSSLINSVQTLDAV